MLDLSPPSVGFIGEPMARLEELRRVGVLRLNYEERKEGERLLGEWMGRLKEKIAAEVLELYPVKAHLARDIGMDSANIAGFLNYPNRMSTSFIALVSLLDERLAMAFPAYREITDWFYVDHRPTEQIIELATHRALRELTQAREEFSDRINRILGETAADQGEEYRHRGTGNGA